MPQNFAVPLAALLAPRKISGEVDVAAAQNNVDWVLARGVRGVVIGGGTAEYITLSLAARKQLFEAAVEAGRGKGQLLAAVGAADIADCLDLAEHAFTCGAEAVLLPTPYFYPRTEEDIETFYRTAAASIEGPILLYNLPAFTTPISTDLALRLIESVPNIIGIKDSSGKLETLQAITARADLDAHPILGHEIVLAEALAADCIETIISGLAGVMPELIVAMFDAHRTGQSDQLASLGGWVREFIAEMEKLPFPVALKLAARRRGLFNPRLALPLSQRQMQVAEEFEVWFEGFQARLETLSRLEQETVPC